MARFDIPERHGPYTTCVNRFNRWRKGRRLGSASRKGLRRRKAPTEPACAALWSPSFNREAATDVVTGI